MIECNNGDYVYIRGTEEKLRTRNKEHENNYKLVADEHNVLIIKLKLDMISNGRTLTF